MGRCRICGGVGHTVCGISRASVDACVPYVALLSLEGIVVIEVDFLWVGEETKTGDAICARFTDPSTGRDAVVVVDGGFIETGDRVVSHIQRYYGTQTVDLVICTHPDDDH